MAEKLEKRKYECGIIAIDQQTNESITLTNQSNVLTVIKRYTQNSFTNYKLKLNVSNRDLDKLIKGNILYSVKITSNMYDETGNTPMQDKVSTHVLKPYGKPSDIQTAPDDPSKEGEQPSSEPLFKITFNCYDVKDIDKNKRIVDAVYKDASPIDIISHILTSDPSLTAEDAIVIDSLDNNSKIRTALIPQLAPLKAITYLQTVYNLYISGMIVFVDNGVVYVLRTDKASDDSGIKSRVTYKYLAKKDNAISKDGSYYDDTTSMFTIYTESLPSISKQSDQNNEALGESITIGSYDSRFDPYVETFLRTENNNSERQKSTYYWRNYTNDTASQTFVEASKAADNSVMINFTNINPEIFNPTTEINIQGSKDADGMYKLNTVSYAIVHDSMVGSCSLRKIVE